MDSTKKNSLAMDTTNPSSITPTWIIIKNTDGLDTQYSVELENFNST